MKKTQQRSKQKKNTKSKQTKSKPKQLIDYKMLY